MTSTESTRCPRCGTVRAARSLDLCATCLLSAALAIDPEPFPYQIVAPIGESASGITYLAQGAGTARRYVALKVLAGTFDADGVLERYQQWKPALDRIDHPHVVSILDVGLTVEGTPYVASEYVAGWPLTALDAHPAIGQEQRRALTGQLTEAVEAAHRAGVTHLALDESRIKVSTAAGLYASILGFGDRLVVNGATGTIDDDRAALARIVESLCT